MFVSISFALLTSSLAAYALPANRSTTFKRDVNPKVASTTSYGNLVDTGFNRDSCTSTGWSNGNVLWTCRDTQQVNPDGTVNIAVIANTASYSTKPSDPSNPQPLVLQSPQGFGPMFYELENDECPQYGLCSDNSRWVGWPDTAPVVVFGGSNGAVNSYAFIAKQHLSGLSALNTPSYSLYHVISMDGNTNVMPATNVEVSSFWSDNQIGYGSAAGIARGSYAYLYGATPNGQLALARAALTGFLGALGDKSIYEYYVNGQWTRNAPARNDSGIGLDNTRSAQGTVYWSEKWQSYVWIGGDGFPNANFYVSTAPNPEGPWTSPQLFYEGEVGTGALPAYSAVAHPGLTDGTGNYIFITWTKLSPNQANIDVYSQPLVRVDWA